MKKVRLSDVEIKHLAQLAGLHLTADEIAKYQQQLSETVAYVKNLEELDTKGVVPTNQTTSLENVTFVDGTPNRRQLKQSDALAGAKQSRDGFFVVDRII